MIDDGPPHSMRRPPVRYTRIEQTAMTSAEAELAQALISDGPSYRFGHHHTWSRVSVVFCTSFACC